MVSSSSARMPLWNVYNLVIISIVTGIASSLLGLPLLDKNFLQLSICSGNYNWKCFLTTSSASILQCPPQEECEVCKTCDDIQCPPKCQEWKDACLECDSQCPPNCEQLTSLGCPPTTEQCNSCTPNCDQCGTGSSLCSDCASEYKSAADICHEKGLFRCSSSDSFGDNICFSQIFFGSLDEAKAKCGDLANSIPLPTCSIYVYSLIAAETTYKEGGGFDKCIRQMTSFEPTFNGTIPFYAFKSNSGDDFVVVNIPVTNGVPKGSSNIGPVQDSSVVRRYVCLVKFA